jgi:hypothetical protein
MAVASLVLGIVGVVTCFLILPSLLAVIFGAVALNQIKKEPTLFTGRGLAVAGLVLGIVMLVVFGLALAFGNVDFNFDNGPR